MRSRQLLPLLLLALLILGCARKQQADADGQETPPAPLDLWAGVPPLEPSAEELVGELVPKPGPPKPKQVGETIDIPFPPPVPASPPVGETEVPEGPLEVLRHGPDGEQGLVEAIRVAFNHPMVPLASIEQLRAHDPPMQIEPAIEGEFRWMGTRALAFYPSGRLPYSTTFTITIPAGTTSTLGTTLPKVETWTITTPTLAFDRTVPYNQSTHIELDQPILLRFNQPVDKQKIAGAIELRAGGKAVALELVPESSWDDEVEGVPAQDQLGAQLRGWITGSDEAWERARVVVLRPASELRPNTKYELQLPAGVYGEGPARSGALKTSFRTYPPLTLSPGRCDPSPCSASYGIEISASNRIRDAQVADKVHVTPEVQNLQINAGYGGISLSGDFVGDSSYTVRVDAGLEDIYDQKLGKPFSAKIRLGPLEPDLRVWPQAKHPGIIEANAAHTLTLKVSGVRELEVMAASFDSAELDDYYRYSGSYDSDYAWPAALGQPEHETKLDVAASREREQTIVLDLDEYRGAGDPFVYLLIRSEEFTRWGWKERAAIGQIIQLTNLGITAAVDRDDGVVLITDLATGEPIPGAELSVLADHGTREVWKGKADDGGIVKPQFGSRSLNEAVLVARNGEDEAFVSLGRSDLRGNWLGWLLGTPAESEVRAFMFTERQPYKPGETVHLVGVLRRETRGPKGGVELWGAGLEFDYEVMSPRGVEVQKGKLRASAFGTFSVDIETDENGDTGTFNFTLSHTGLFGSSERFSHGFAVEAFRTPEFEVEVERPESGPLHFGDELVVEIHGRYLFGAPMVGADVNYTLTRQASDFRPPAEGLAGFHFSSTPGQRWYWGGWAPTQHLDGGARKLDRDGVFELRHALHQVEPPKPGSEPKPKPEPEPKQDPPRPATFTVGATVIDQNRQAIAQTASFVVHPAAYYVGLHSERAVLREHERTRVEAVVVDVDGERIAGVEIALEAVRKHTTRKPVQKNGVWTFEYETDETKTSDCTLASAAAPVACELSVGEAGTHEILAKITDADGRQNQAALTIYVHGEDAVVWDEDQKRVDLVADKPSYEPGETAKILIRSPFDQARGFLVVEREGRAQTHDLVIEGGAATVDVTIEPEMIAGVTVSAVLSRSRTAIAGAPSDQDLGAPAAATGSLALEVSKDQKTVVVEVEPELDRIEPGDTLKVDLHTHATDGSPIPAAVALFVVDEGVLSLMGYQTPDPLGFFHHPRPGEVGLFADHVLVLPRNAAEQPDTDTATTATPDPDVLEQDQMMPLEEAEASDEGSIGHGGGTGSGYGNGRAESKNKDRKQAKKRSAPGAVPPPSPSPLQANAGIDANLAMAQEVSLRTLFASTAYFEAEIETDDDGRASVEVKMPENLTSFRIMAVAVDPTQIDRFGSGEATVRVRKAIMLRPSLPRFLNLGDSFEASVMVDNQSEELQTVMVGTRGLNVKLGAEVETSVEIPAGESREVRFPMAVDHVGTMRLQFAALANNGRDATQLDIPVLVPATKQAFADYGMTSSSILRQVELPEDALPGFGGLEVSLSSTALSGLEDAVDFLVSYPYECSEQTASRLLPIFALGEVLDDFPIADVHDRARRDALARAGIERLLQRQNWDGGFTYWGEDERHESWPYVSTWVTLALLEGKHAGYEVDADKLQAAMRYLENYIRNGVSTRWGPYYDHTTRAFALWLMAREDAGGDLFDRVWAQRSKMPLYARVLLASAAHRYGREGPVAEVLDELRDLVVEDARVIHFAESRTEAAADGLAVLMHSNTQTDAIVLMTLLELGEETGDDGMAAKIMAGLIDDRDPKIGGRWTTTQANAWALMAASRYYAVIESETPNYEAQIWIDDSFAGSHTFAGRDMTKINQAIPMKKLLEQSIGSVTLAKDGPGKLYYRLGLRYAPADFDMDPVDRGFSVSRVYEALADPGEDEPDPEAVHRLDDGSWTVQAGTNVRVTLTVVVQDRASYVVVDDPLPAGFEGQNPRFSTSVAAQTQGTREYGYEPGGRYGRGGYDYNYGGGYGWWWPWYSFDHTQMRDDRMLLFADWLPAGVYTYSYTARATNLGTFVLPPVHAECMYQPERFGHGSSSVVSVIE